MKKVVVISDTHIPKKAKCLPANVTDEIKSADMVIHAGDINMDYVIYELQEIVPVEAVAGNTDDEFVKGLLGTKKVINIENCKIGIIHGDGISGTTSERVIKAFKDDGVNCIVFGHSHIPVNIVVDGVLLFNPGSPTDKRRQPMFSYGILIIDDNKISGDIKFF